MIYSYVCDSCGTREDRLRLVADRDNPIFCQNFGGSSFGKGEPCEQAVAAIAKPMRREIGSPAVHYKGHGWTRTPAIMREPIAEGHPGQRENWGTGSASEYGDPNLISPYKHVIGAGGTDLGQATVGPDGKSVVEAGSQDSGGSEE